MKRYFPFVLGALVLAGLITAGIFYYKSKADAAVKVIDDEAAEDLKSMFGGEMDTFTLADGSALDIFSIKHASLAIRAEEKWIYLDPVTSAAQPETDYGTLPKADYILFTHSHFDHFDSLAVKQLRKDATSIIANEETIELLGFGDVLRNGDTRITEEGWTIEAVPAYNDSPEKLQYHPRGRDNGYILTIGGLRLYVAGDTEPIPELSQFGKIDVAFLPCNLPFTMTPEQCAEAVKVINPKVLFPYHYGGTDTPTDLKKLASLLEGTGIDVRIRQYE